MFVSSPSAELRLKVSTAVPEVLHISEFRGWSGHELVDVKVNLVAGPGPAIPPVVAFAARYPTQRSRPATIRA
jgi:hypothetical protein